MCIGVQMGLRKTKIVATVGPASSSEEMIARMIAAGVDVVRLNFSHGTNEEHFQRVGLVREIAGKIGRPVGILCDLQGPKIRIGKFALGGATLQAGDKFMFDIECELGDEERVGLDYKSLPQEVKPGDVLLLDDGRVVMSVDRVGETRVYCTVLTGGVLSNNKGINRKGGGLAAAALTEKDRQDIKTAVAFGADFIAMSFPRDARDVLQTRSLLEEAGGN